MTIVIFILVLLVCVVAHEFGHFIVAKKSGMLVEEFGFGIPPRLWSVKRGETRYSINALPIGGFVKIAGEDDSAQSTAPRERQFAGKPWYLRAAVLVAGVACNMILAFVLFTAAYAIGMPAITDGGVPTVTSIAPGSPASVSGLSVGDVVRATNVAGTSIAPSTEALHGALVKSAAPLVITYIHHGVEHTVTIVPEGTGDNRRAGLAIDPVGVVHHGLIASIANAWRATGAMTSAVWTTLAGLVGGLFRAHAPLSGLMGPVGLAGATRDAAAIGIAYLLAFTAAISVNLAVLNIMPFPALDGGRLLVVLLEAITGRTFSPKVAGWIHAAGFIVLLALMAALTVGDIKRLL